MTIYRLPDGAEVRPADSNLLKVQTLANHTWVIHPTLGAISCYTGLLTEVEPPLPPEPPNGAVLCNGIDVFIRCDDENNPDVGAWYCTGDKQTWAWAEVVPTINPGYKRYIPDPADDAPALPWTLDSCRRSASVGTPKHGTVVVDVPGIDYTPGELEQIARALLAAARAAREVEQS